LKVIVGRRSLLPTKAGKSQSPSPVLLKGKTRATAAILSFAMFAVGVLAGTALGAGRRARTRGGEAKRKG
jgi:hypothetical protein